MLCSKFNNLSEIENPDLANTLSGKKLNINLKITSLLFQQRKRIIIDRSRQKK